MKFAAFAFVLLCLAGVGSALAGPVEDRIQLMKENNAAFKEMARYALGLTTPYDSAAVKDLSGRISTQIAEFVTLFPEGSQDDKARPEIWHDMADFQAHADDLKAAVASAGDAADANSLKAALGLVNVACNACHDKYRN